MNKPQLEAVINGVDSNMRDNFFNDYGQELSPHMAVRIGQLVCDVGYNRVLLTSTRFCFSSEQIKKEVLLSDDIAKFFYAKSRKTIFNSFKGRRQFAFRDRSKLAPALKVVEDCFSRFGVETLGYI